MHVVGVSWTQPLFIKIFLKEKRRKKINEKKKRLFYIGSEEIPSREGDI